LIEPQAIVISEFDCRIQHSQATARKTLS